MKAKNRILPIVWAIDPYETRNTHRAPLAKFLKALSQGLPQRILPFSVVSLPNLTWPIPVEYGKGMNLEELGTLAVESDLKKLHMKNVARPTVEVHDRTSRRELIKDVLRFSKKKRAGFIAVNTRRLLSPFPFKVGGFAEALLGRSEIPVIAVSPKAKVSGRIKRILFPTDFSTQSHRAFRKTLQLAASLKARIHLVHLETFAPMPQYAFTDVPLYQDEEWMKKSRRDHLRRHHELAKSWQNEARVAGVSCNYQILEKPTSVAKAILDSARSKRADLISLASYRGPRALALIGGTVRDVLSSAKTPVLEFHAA